MAKKPVPSYKKPPVVEVVWSAQFAKLPWLTAAHTGLFWKQIRESYPKCEEQAPVERNDEPEELLQAPQVFAEFLAKPPLCRQWFISESGNELVQLQLDRFCVNWRKVKPDDAYPRYEYMREQFASRWRQFCDFTQAQKREPPKVDLLDMTYVNHIFKGEGWSAPGDIGKVFPVISFHKKSDFLPPPASLGSNMVFDLKQTRGRLHVSCRHAKLLEGEKRELFRLEMVARGRPERTEPEGLLLWFSEAREWIVRGFADLTDPDIQVKQWGREQ
jgi:uncharacterized protein (TIGR04255 family)